MVLGSCLQDKVLILAQMCINLSPTPILGTEPDRGLPGLDSCPSKGGLLGVFCVALKQIITPNLLLGGHEQGPEPPKVGNHQMVAIGLAYIDPTCLLLGS